MPPAQRNTPRAPDSTRRSAPSAGRSRDAGAPQDGWIWGRHAVLAALANPRRRALALHVTRNAAAELPETLPDGLPRPEPEHPGDIDKRLPAGAVHQGFALRAAALEPERLAAVADPTHGLLVVLDQITDPHNVGAVFRSALAFGARAVVMQDRKAPPLFGAAAKSAVGACEALAHVRVVNVADAILKLREAGRFVVGLAGEADAALPAVLERHAGPGLVLVLGAEDKGLRPRVAQSCDALARIPISPRAESLNVSNAAAIALYEASRRDPRLNPPFSPPVSPSGGAPQPD